MIFILTACYPFDSEDKEQLTEKEEVDQEADEKELTRKREQTPSNEERRNHEEKNNEKIFEEMTLEEALLQYINVDLIYAYELEDKAITSYESVTGTNYTDDPTTLHVLKHDVIPDYTRFVKELKMIDVNNRELNELHYMYIEGAELQLEAFHIFAEGIETGNIALINEGNAVLSEGYQLIDQYVKELENLAQQYSIQFY